MDTGAYVYIYIYIYMDTYIHAYMHTVIYAQVVGSTGWGRAAFAGEEGGGKVEGWEEEGGEEGGPEEIFFSPRELRGKACSCERP